MKNLEKNTTTAALVVVCMPAAGLRVQSCCRWLPQCLSPLGHRSLERALVTASFQSVPLLPRSNKQNAPRSFRCWSEKSSTVPYGRFYLVYGRGRGRLSTAPCVRFCIQNSIRGRRLSAVPSVRFYIVKY